MDKIWAQYYQAGVPTEINPDVHQSLNEIFENACEKYAHLPAFENFGCTITFKKLHQHATQFAAFLVNDCHFKKGERFAIMMPNMMQYPIALFGALLAGATVVNINPLYTPRELEFQLKDAQVKGVIVLENFAHTVQVVSPNVSLEIIIITKPGDIFPLIKGHVLNAVNRYIKKNVPFYHFPQAISFKKIIGKKVPTDFRTVTLSGRDIAFLQYTGGTTGVAKGAILTHRNMVANMEQASAWIKPILYTDRQEVVVSPLPLYHIFALTANCLVFIKYGARNILITNPRDIKSFIKIIKNKKFTFMTGVNTLFNAILNHPQCKAVDFSQLKVALGGGMAVQRAVSQRWEDLTGKPILEAYGLTETSPAVCMNPLNNTEFNGFIGLPVPSTEVAILDEAGTILPTGEVGELCVKGPQVTPGYWQRPQETEKAFTKDGWFRTGDMAYMEARGYIKIVDRKKDMILVSGFNVYPNEVEDVIALHPKVKEVAVIGVPDATTGEAVSAFVVPVDASLNSREIIQFCRGQLTAYKIPTHIEFREFLPKTNVGKILRRALREEAEK